MGLVIAGEGLAGDGIAGAIVPKDPKTRHQQIGLEVHQAMATSAHGEILKPAQAPKRLPANGPEE